MYESSKTAVTTSVTDDSVVTTTVVAVPRRIEYKEVLDSVKVMVDDGAYDTPWDDLDGYEHSFIKTCDVPDKMSIEDAAGYCYSYGHRYHGVIELSDGDVFGIYEYMRSNGASKQVAAQAVAASKRRIIKSLTDWYANGWCWYLVCCDFRGIALSHLCGYLSEEDAMADVESTVVADVVYKLEEVGYIVVNKPDTSSCNRDAFKLRMKRNMKMQVCGHR